MTRWIFTVQEKNNQHKEYSISFNRSCNAIDVWRLFRKRFVGSGIPVQVAKERA